MQSGFCFGLPTANDGVLGFDAACGRIIARVAQELHFADLEPVALLERKQQAFHQRTGVEEKLGAGFESAGHGSQELGVADVVVIAKAVAKTESAIERVPPGEI